ncbi:hypothetical protein BDN71DRAFT_1485429 [Pleurotus eryngii]|uniref:Uncharacterized protein n=1 Tax=Pleurotus eryngii TaxID=5323 RepID=A0A9P5ZEQ9_PLEER|nr:hypothetical protein BDN71DRAFT_1485429 [Pleurotus eryngii]
MYPLAIISKVLDMLGPRVLMGYNIGCSFQSTVASSSLVSRARDQGLRLCVNTFHGTGLEDLETLECVFSVSNQLVNVAWYASAFQHQLFIDNFFCQWDEDKYQNLGVMLYNNYKQALDIINTDFIALQEAMNFLNIQEEDFAWWQNKEIEYVSQLSTESEENLLHITYVEMLQKLHNNE